MCRLCRRERAKLFLKGQRCNTIKCPMSDTGERRTRAFAPGEHGRDRSRQGSEYLVQLREKQRTRRTYGVLEGQFRKIYEEASRRPGIAGENLLAMLEMRLDNVAYRAGWGSSRAQARQLVRHGHVLVNSRRVDIPSYQVRPGDEISLSEKAQGFIVLRHNLDTIDRAVPAWLEQDSSRHKVRVVAQPTRDQIDEPVREQLIVELYSK